WSIDLKHGASNSFEEKAKELYVRIAFDVALMPADDPKRKLVRMSFGFGVRYSYTVEGGPEGADRDAFFDAFARVNAVHNAWPYLREVVQSTGARMGLPPIVFPVHRMQPAP